MVLLHPSALLLTFQPSPRRVLHRGGWQPFPPPPSSKMSPLPLPAHSPSPFAVQLSCPGYLCEAGSPGLPRVAILVISSSKFL